MFSLRIYGGLMRYVYLLCLLLMYENVWGSEPKDMPLIESHFELNSKEPLPSCKMFQYRQKEREKVLREKLHNLHQDLDLALLLKDQYITNKFFLDETLWRDETVTVVNTWSIPEELSQRMQAGAHPVFHLSGDGINWVEQIAYFPEEVTFTWDLDQHVLETRHQTYYVDFCKPRDASRLTWTTEDLSKYFLSVMQWQKALQLIKEN